MCVVFGERFSFLHFFFHERSKQQQPSTPSQLREELFPVRPQKQNECVTDTIAERQVGPVVMNHGAPPWF